MKVAEALKMKWTQKNEASTHPQQHKNKGILHCVAIESESENKKMIMALIYCSITIEFNIVSH